MPWHGTLMRLAAFAEDQWGLVTRRQAEAAGISRATLTRLVSDRDIERVALGVYRLAGAPPADHLDLRAAWLQLAPETSAWKRTPEQGVISYGSAAALYGIGHLPADRHEFTLPTRRQTRRSDVRLHVAHLGDSEWVALSGLPVTKPSRIAADLLSDREEPQAVGQLITDAISGNFDYPGSFARAISPYAAQLGFRRGDGLSLLRWLLDVIGDPRALQWLAVAESSLRVTGGRA